MIPKFGITRLEYLSPERKGSRRKFSASKTAVPWDPFKIIRTYWLVFQSLLNLLNFVHIDSFSN